MAALRLLRLLALVVLAVSGRAAVAPERQTPADPSGTPSVGAPRQSIPTPVHDEATCAFCQAAVFPPLAPAGSAVVPLALSSERAEPAPPPSSPPHAGAGRRPSSRAPPTLRFV